MASQTLPMSAKRVRRTPEQARRLILDAAEASMGLQGPAGLRLTDVAAAAGVSHPTLLHHFGSRDGLVRALNQRTVESLKATLLGVLRADQTSSKDVVAVVFDAYRTGLAQRLVWMMQATQAAGGPPAGDLDPQPGGLPLLETMVTELHALRQRYSPGRPIPEADTRAIVHVTTIAAFGDALIGRRIRGAISPAEEAKARQDFELWFGRLLDRHIVGEAG